MVTQYFYTCSKISIKLIWQCSSNCKWILNKFLFAVPASNFSLINYKCTHRHTLTQIHSHLKFCIFTVWRLCLLSIFEAFCTRQLINENKGIQNQETNWFKLRYPRSHNNNNNNSINKEQAKNTKIL